MNEANLSVNIDKIRSYDHILSLLVYRKVWLISACAYHSRWQGNMRLIDDVCLIESEVLALTTASTFEHSVTKLASYDTVILGINSVIVHGSMIGSHRWKKTVEK